MTREVALSRQDRLKRFLVGNLPKSALDGEKKSSFWLKGEFLLTLRTSVTLDEVRLASHGTE